MNEYLPLNKNVYRVCYVPINLKYLGRAIHVDHQIPVVKRIPHNSLLVNHTKHNETDRWQCKGPTESSGAWIMTC